MHSFSKDLYFRRASSLIITFKKNEIVYFNFLQKKGFKCNYLGLDMLKYLENSQALEHILTKYSKNFSQSSIITSIINLIDAGAIVVEDTKEQLLDSRYAQLWEWDVVAGLYHFSIKDPKFLSEKGIVKALNKRKKEKESPPLYLTNESFKTVIKLKKYEIDTPLNKIIFNRRSYRFFNNKEISLKHLSSCLFSGLGIISFVEEEPFGKLPIKLTPSGGARNPYEAYVYIKKVNGITPAFYHYSAFDNTLGLVNSVRPKPEKLLGGQKWVNDASALVFLVANFDRSIWKYQHPNGYRVVLIEAGHIAQNMALTATSLGLASCSTAAINDKYLTEILNLDTINQSVIYAFVLGVKKKIR